MLSERLEAARTASRRTTTMPSPAPESPRPPEAEVAPAVWEVLRTTVWSLLHATSAEEAARVAEPVVELLATLEHDPALPSPALVVEHLAAWVSANPVTQQTPPADVPPGQAVCVLVPQHPSGERVTDADVSLVARLARARVRSTDIVDVLEDGRVLIVLRGSSAVVTWRRATSLAGPQASSRESELVVRGGVAVVDDRGLTAAVTAATDAARRAGAGAAWVSLAGRPTMSTA